MDSYLLGAGGQLDPGPLGVGVVGDDSCVVARSPGKLATVTGLLLKVAHNGSLRHVADGHDVADGEVGLLAAVHKLSSVHTYHKCSIRKHIFCKNLRSLMLSITGTIHASDEIVNS